MVGGFVDHITILKDLHIAGKTSALSKVYYELRLITSNTEQAQKIHHVLLQEPEYSPDLLFKTNFLLCFKDFAYCVIPKLKKKTTHSLYILP